MSPNRSQLVEGTSVSKVRTAISVAVFLVAVVAGCEQSTSQSPVPTTDINGKVDLVWLRSDAREIVFRLSNGSKGPVAFLGSRHEDGSAMPWNALFRCKSIVADAWVEGPLTIVDGESESIRVAPGTQQDLIIELESQLKFLRSNSGETCELELTLEDESKLKSASFTSSKAG
jgi:hypothetical protein